MHNPFSDFLSKKALGVDMIAVFNRVSAEHIDCPLCNPKIKAYLFRASFTRNPAMSVSANFFLEKGWDKVQICSHVYFFPSSLCQT